MHAHAMIAVWMNVAKEHDQEFSDWYETEHLAEVVTIDGILSGRRYCNSFSQYGYSRFVCGRRLDDDGLDL